MRYAVNRSGVGPELSLLVRVIENAVFDYLTVGTEPADFRSAVALLFGSRRKIFVDLCHEFGLDPEVMRERIRKMKLDGVVYRSPNYNVGQTDPGPCECHGLAMWHCFGPALLCTNTSSLGVCLVSFEEHVSNPISCDHPKPTAAHRKRARKIEEISDPALT